MADTTQGTVKSYVTNTLWENYTANNPYSSRLGDGVRKMFEQAVEAVKVDDNRPVYIGDHATADGGASLKLFDWAIATLKKRYGPDQCIVLVYEDLPLIDFRVLFRNIQGLTRYANVLPLFSLTNFFAQCMPPESMDIILNTGALHWLSQKPCDLQNSLTIVTSDDLAEQVAFAKQAAEDWNTYLKHRAVELRKGGYLVIGCHEGKRRYPLYELADKVWADMLDNAVISKEEFVKATFSFYHRSVEEYRKPFVNSESSVFKSGLRMVDIYTLDLPKPDYAQLDVPKPTKLSEAQIRDRYLLDARRWLEKTIRDALNSDRTEGEKDRVLETFFENLFQSVTLNPKQYVEMTSFAMMLIKKEI